MSDRPNYPPSEQPAQPPSPAEMESGDESADVMARWNAISANFVEDPRQAVSDADNLVATALDQVTQSLAAQREELVRRWSSAREQLSTEELRLCLQRYRALFQRLTNAAA